MTQPQRTTAPRDTVRIADRVASALMSRIASGELAPGSRLPGERQLAEAMGVSRVSVRAALQRLRARGLVDAVQGGGTRVISTAASLDPPMTELLRTDARNLRDLAQIRLGLEVWGARRAAEAATADDLAALKRTVEAMDRARGRARAEHDVNFHVLLARASHSAVYIHLFEAVRHTLSAALERRNWRPFVHPVDDDRLMAQHRAVVDAIERRDPDGAARAITEHLSWVLERLDAEGRRQADAPSD